MLITLVVLLFLAIWKTGEPAAITETVPSTDNLRENVAMSMKGIEKELENIMKSLTKMALPFFVRNSNSNYNVSTSCMSTLMQMFMDLRKLKFPVIKMLDAMPKLHSGLLKGANSIMGDYDECLEIKVNKKGDPALTESEEVYHGQYCMVEIDPPPILMKNYIDYRNKKINISAFGKFGQLIVEIPAVNTADDFFTFKVGICMPSTCSTHDLQQFLALVPLPFFSMRVKYCEDGKAQQVNVGQAMFIAFLLLLGTLVISGTVFEMFLYMKPSGCTEQKNQLARLLLAFSFYSNTKKMMKLDKNSSSSQIPAINGMYVIGSLFVIIYHTYFMPFFMTFSSHAIYLGQSMTDWKFTIMSTMGISIDCYFLFSGIFMVYPRYRREEKEVKVNVLKIIVQRYLRFCPSMLVILGIMVSLPLIGSGPVWPEIFGVTAANTRKWWWTYVLMFNNFLEVKEQSFFPLWFIPCLMQITVVGAILVCFMSKNRHFGIFMIVVTSLSCSIALGVLTYLRNYPLTYAMYYYYEREYIEVTTYTSPLSHIPPYGIGMIVGYFMAKKPNMKLSKTHVTAGWLLSIFLIFGTQMFCYIAHEGQDLDPILSAVYAATHRSLYSFGMAWIILACSYGYGGVLGEFLSWKGFGILAKLSYCGYLIHYIVIAYHVSFTRVPLSFSHYEIFIRFSGYATVSMAASYILYITFELPMMYIETLLFPRIPNTNMNNNITYQANENYVDDSFSKNSIALDSKLQPPPWENPKFSKVEEF